MGHDSLAAKIIRLVDVIIALQTTPLWLQN